MSDWSIDDKVLSAPERGIGSESVGVGMSVESAVPPRVDLDPKSVERGLSKLVLSIVELIRQLLERQALRRVESGRLDETEIERLGETLLRLEQRMQQLKSAFGLTDADLRLELGPLQDLDGPHPSE